MGDNNYLLSLILVVWFLNWGVCAPMVFYYLRRYRLYGKKMPIKKRHDRIVIALNITALVFLIVDRPLAMLAVSAYPARYDWGGMAVDVLDSFSSFTYSYLYYAFLFIILWRYWMLFYKFNFQVRVLSSQWKSFLDVEAGSESNDWFLKNHHSFGSRKNSFIVLVVAYSLFASAVCVVYLGTVFGYLSDHNAIIVDTVFFTVPIMAAVALWIKTPSYHDEFYVRDEMALFIAIYAFDLVASYVFAFSIPSYYWEETFFVLMETLTFTGMCLTTTMYVVKRIDVDEKKRGYRFATFSNANATTVVKIDAVTSAFASIKAQATPKLSPMAISKELSKSRSGDQKKAGGFELSGSTLHRLRLVNDIICDSEGYDLLMQYLTREFSMECLLSMTEFTQYKTRLLADTVFATQLLAELMTLRSAPIEKSKSRSEALQTEEEKKEDARAALDLSEEEEALQIAQATGLLKKFEGNITDALASIKYKDFRLPLPDDIPNSAIVYKGKAMAHKTSQDNRNAYAGFIQRTQSEASLTPEQQKSRMFKMIAYALYCRYVDATSAELEVNISYATKMTLFAQMNNMKRWISVNNHVTHMELFEIFDPAMRELMLLLKDAVRRFKRTPEFQKLSEKLDKK